MRPVICLLLLCHHLGARPSDLDTSIFSLDYEYDSEPYLPNSMGMKEARMIDPWTLDFRRKLASRDAIGKQSICAKKFRFSRIFVERK